MKFLISLFSASLFLFTCVKINAQYLYTDVTSTNLPIGTVSGPGMDIESADIDGDGDKDIIIAREFAPNKILINNGNGIFADESNRIPTFSYDSEDIGIADFDRDGDLDIIFASEDNAIHEFYLNRGNGYFDNANNRLPNFTSNALLIIDLNHDTYPDLIFGSNGASNPAPPGFPKVFMNNGNATFTEDSTRVPHVDIVPQDIKAADMDNDGDTDLVFGCEDFNKIFINNGNGFFFDGTFNRFPGDMIDETRKIALGDVDNDGDIDIFFANVNFRGDRDLQDKLFINDGSGHFADRTITNLPVDTEHTLDAAFIDFNFDGNIDLITSNAFTNRPMKAFQNNGTGIFTEVTGAVFPPTAIAEGLGMKIDFFNNDSLPDIYLVHRRTSTSGGSDRLLFRNNPFVGVNFISSPIPENYSLAQNYPNPFNPETVIKFDIQKSGFVNLSVFDTKGNLIENLVQENLNTGEYSVKWQPLNLSSGIYYYKLSVNNFIETKKMLLVK